MDLDDLSDEDEYEVNSLSSMQSEDMEFEESEDLSDNESLSLESDDEDSQDQAEQEDALTDAPLLERLRRPAVPLPDTDYLDDLTEEEDREQARQELVASVALLAAGGADRPPPAAAFQEVAACSEKEQAAEAVPVTPAADTSSTDEDGQICTICFEPWTNMSDHRLVSLRCGHLFGRSCITRWLKNQNRCPQCNARARKSEIRNIYAKAVKVLDSSERDKALQDLMKESELRRKAEITAAQERLKHMMALQECERLKKDLMEAHKLIQNFRSNSAGTGCSQSQKPVSLFKLEKIIEVAKFGGCRIVDSNSILGMILVSQPSTNELFDGYGIRKISTLDMKPAEFVLMHQKPIRDMTFHPNDGLVLTAALDKSLKITNVLSNSVVQTYNVESDAWSCAWDTENPVYFYGGLKTGDVYVFDIRTTRTHVHQLPRFGAKTPVVSLQYLNCPSSVIPKRRCGPVVGKLSDSALAQKTDIPGTYQIVPLPALGPLVSLSSEKNGNFLISCRPSSKQPFVNHTLCEMESNESNELVCNPLHTVLGGKTQVQLTRSKILPHPSLDTSVLICAADEDSRGALIWDGSSGNKIDHLRTESPVLDFAGLKLNGKSYLSALTDKTLLVYGWDSS